MLSMINLKLHHASVLIERMNDPSHAVRISHDRLYGGMFFICLGQLTNIIPVLLVHCKMMRYVIISSTGSEKTAHCCISRNEDCLVIIEANFIRSFFCLNDASTLSDRDPIVRGKLLREMI